jgi:primosomal protein N' (replication factor Y)
VAPVPTLAGVVVLDADDERLVAEGAPTWSAVDLAVERARRSAAPVLLVTSCPTPALAVLPARRGLGSAAIAAGWPRFVIADRRGADPRTGRYSEQMVAAAHRALAAQPDGVAVVCLLNRTGRARLLACRTCSAIARCEHCEAAVVADGDDLVCPRCATRRPVVCVGCGATAMKVLRAGTTQVAEEVGLLLGVPTAELTAKGEDIEGARCVVGTEAVLHRLRRTSLVVFLDIDATLLAPRAGAEIETLRQIGRAGRLVGGRGAGDGGVVMVQTRVGEHPVLAAAERGCVDEVVRDDVEIRAALRLPPTRACATIRGEGAGELAARLDGLGLEVRRLEDGRQVALADTTAALCDALAAAGRPKARVSVAVDQEPT